MRRRKSPAQVRAAMGGGGGGGSFGLSSLARVALHRASSLQVPSVNTYSFHPLLACTNLPCAFES